MRADPTIDCVADVGAMLGEGPVWLASESALFWVDIKGRKIFRLGPDGALDQWDAPFRVGSLSPRRGGGFLAGTDQGLAEIDLTTGHFRIIAHPEADRPDNRFNDGKVDRAGRLWVGSMDDSEQAAAGALYRVGPGLECSRVDDGYTVTNGPAFSPSGSVMYHNDSGRQLTYAFDLDTAGNATDRRIFAKYGEGDGYPDGMTVDSEGCLWIAFWDGWCLRRLSPTGERLATVPMPVQRPTSCAFGGEALDRLYVTSASIGLTPEERVAQPCAGGLFMLDAGVAGLAELPFDA